MERIREELMTGCQELCKGKGALHTRKSLIGQFELKYNLILCNSVLSETLNPRAASLYIVTSGH